MLMIIVFHLTLYLLGFGISFWHWDWIFLHVNQFLKNLWNFQDSMAFVLRGIAVKTFFQIKFDSEPTS
jgi:hypothetical protein